MSTILCVDDEPQILRALAVNLKARAYDVVTAITGEQALVLAAERRPDAVILDLGLPGISGIEVIEGLRGWLSVPIIVLSARDGEAAKIAALDAGADDYVTKPFGMGELLARLRAALRRGVVDEAQPLIVAGSLQIDLAGRRVTVDGVIARLTPTELHLVEVLARNAGKLVTSRQLLQEVWGPNYGDETNYLRVHMAHIRRKLEPEPATPRYFRTEPGIGYRFDNRSVDSSLETAGVDFEPDATNP